ncbi:diguanylate cyclase (GGDEF)-like protein [Paraburkholderia sp. GAS448]
MVDVDAFKRYNDHYGHLRGDECLRTIAQTLVAAARYSTDIVARYGDEEFALLLKDADREGTLAVGEHIRQAVENLRIPHATSPAGIVTISVGVAADRAGNRDDGGGGDLIAASDRALYSAKRLGRNRTCMAVADDQKE